MSEMLEVCQGWLEIGAIVNGSASRKEGNGKVGREMIRT